MERVRELSVPGFSFVHLYDEVTSTMDVARERAASLGRGCGSVCALVQSEGRGRQGRRWASAADALMMTALFPTTEPVAALSGYSLVVGLALVDAFERFGAKLQLKWPNDLVVVKGDALHKVGGILIEVQDLADRRVVLVGVGINLRSVPGDVPNASSIEDISGEVVGIEEALSAASQQLRVAHDLFVSLGGFARFRERWEEASCFEMGRTEISIDLGARTESGVYAGVDERGSLLLTHGEGVTAYHSGHIAALKGLRR